MEFYQMDTGFPLNQINWKHLSAISLLSNYKESSLDGEDISTLADVYKTMFPNRRILPEHLSTSIKKYGTIGIFNQQFGSRRAYRSKRSTGIVAAWPRSDGGISENSMQQIFGLVDYYLCHSLKSDQEFTKFLPVWHGFMWLQIQFLAS